MNERKKNLANACKEFAISVYHILSSHLCILIPTKNEQKIHIIVNLCHMIKTEIEK